MTLKKKKTFCSVTDARPSRAKIVYMFIDQKTDLPLSPKLEMPC